MDGSDVALAVQDTIYAGLDALRAAVPLELCAYLHVSDDIGPQLYLAVPDLSSLEPNEAFDLFSSLRDALDKPPSDELDLQMGRFNAVVVPSEGAASRGLHVLGRHSDPLTAPERRLAVRLCEAFAAVAHTLHGRPERAAPRSPARVAVESIDGRTKAEVGVGVGGDVRTGWGEHEEPLVAVALATVDALDADAEVVHAGDTDAGDEHVVVVVVRTGDRSSAGAAPVGADALRATVRATTQAVDAARS